MYKFQKILAITLAAASLAVISNAIADDNESPEKVAIEYRQGAFHMIKYHFGAMAAMVKGKTEFNAEEFAKNAEAVATLSKFPINGFTADTRMGYKPQKGLDDDTGFSGNETAGSDTEAKPRIWTHMDDFNEKMETFQVEAASLAEVAKGGDMAAIKPQFGKVGESCKACHKEYREED